VRKNGDRLAFSSSNIKYSGHQLSKLMCTIITARAEMTVVGFVLQWCVLMKNYFHGCGGGRGCS